MKKVIVLLCAVLCVSLPAFALELTPEASGKIMDKITAYSPDTINAILEAQGLTLSPEAAAGVPATYAREEDGKVVFSGKSTAFSPVDFDKILKAYGLLDLSPEVVEAKLGGTDYAKVSDGKVVLGTKSAAYSGDIFKAILASYELPGTPVAEVTPTPPTPTPTPTPPPVDTDEDKDSVPDERDKCPGTPPGARVDERGCWVLYINFDFDKSVVKSPYYPALNEVVQIMNQYPYLNIEVEGHTDSIGTDRYNQGLSERRAKAVKDYLINRGGIHPSRLESAGYGESRPAATNATKEGRAKNRRVELTPK
ncbi:MAG: OmpA family protein [Desulfococcaceae bacterium]|jgi:OOP family OmpA-OmpF porin|nr:OmpA family protein [Desulfococcaceae bacterium]